MKAHDQRQETRTGIARVSFATLVLLAVGSTGCRPVASEDAWACQCGTVSAITSGDGNDTEAAWSPDGDRIAFQTDRKGDLDISLVDLKTGAISGIAEGIGHACYPAWAPDGALVYTFGYQAGTAVEAETRKSDSGYGLRLFKDNATRVLTRGHWRDYTPSVTPDGVAVYYASTRDNTENSASLWRLPLAQNAVATRVLHLDGPSSGAVQPSLSPNGAVLLWNQLDGFRSNWRLRAARPDDLADSIPLTPAEMSAYAPRWSPDGRLIAFTGFRGGDPGWGIYLLEPRSGAMTRLKTGMGNSRSPAWSPDGREIVFENNRSGFYKLCRMRVEPRPPILKSPPAVSPATSRVEGRLAVKEGAATLVNADGAAAPAVLQGLVTFPESGGLALDGKGSATFERPLGLDYGAGRFFVRMTLVVDAVGGGPRIAVVGQYAEHPLGWQIFVNDAGHVCFSSRDPKGLYVGVASDTPLKRGTAFTVMGLRDEEGGLRMYLDGALQAGRAAGATMAYGPATKVCLGRQGSGGCRLRGTIVAFETGRGYPPGMKRPPTRQELFAEAVR